MKNKLYGLKKLNEIKMENKLRLNPLKYPTVKCECGCEVWNQGVIIKRIPGLEVGNGTEDTFADLPVYYCAKCGKIIPEHRKMYQLDQVEEKTETPKSDNPSKLLII